MMHFDYICDTCGFTSQEERWVYKCPYVETKWDQQEQDVDNTSSVGRYLITIIVFFIALFVCTLILGPLLEFIATLIITFLVYCLAKGQTQNKFICDDPSFTNPNKTYACG